MLEKTFAFEAFQFYIKKSSALQLFNRGIVTVSNFKIKM